MKPIETVEELRDWEGYRELLKRELKTLQGSGEAVFVSKDKLEFRIEGKPWRGHAVLAGPKGLLSARKLKKAGTLFREGTSEVDGKELVLAGLTPKLVKEAERTFQKLRLGWSVRAGATLADTEDEEAAPVAAGVAEDGDGAALAGRATRIAKAALVWTRTEEAAAGELEKLRKALGALDDPRARVVVDGLETILARLDRVDDEARAVADAARTGDAGAFEAARTAFVAKLRAIRAMVDGDELIRQADANPLTQVKIGATFRKSLDQLLAAV